MARAEEWPIMPTEWVHTMLKPWNFFDETPIVSRYDVPFDGGGVFFIFMETRCFCFLEARF
ncbi:hypothetical protein [Paenibacillus mucilaginosus]|uniref:copper amine oxidase n=1 Tax=Paenibacillus mucilaginosus TaxID=61624 RepID=UPI003D1AAD42